MSIIGTLPNNIQNGQLEDATPLMADFNFIVNQVNANAAPLGTLTAPAGTRMLFNQPAPPVGWTQEVGAAFNDTSVRTVTGAGGATAGSTSWGSWNFGGTFNANAFTISVAQLPAHNHGITDPTHNHAVNDPSHSHGPGGSGANFIYSGSPGGLVAAGSSGTFSGSTANAVTGILLVAAGTGISVQNTGSGSSITPTFTTPQVKYSDYVIGIKS